jgi:23S rRNA pseudouridine1911/1915/1917 synthase
MPGEPFLPGQRGCRAGGWFHARLFLPLGERSREDNDGKDDVLCPTMDAQTYHLTAEHDGLTLAAALRKLLPGQSWEQVRRLIAARKVQVQGNLCLDPQRRVKAADVVKLFPRPLPRPVSLEDIRLVYVDPHLVVVDKPAGITSVRHREEADLPPRRRQLQPTLDELVPQLLAAEEGGRAWPAAPGPSASRRQPAGRRGRTRSLPLEARWSVRPVHRLDRDTSGLVLFARTAQAEQALVRMFARHEVQRIYVAVVHGHVAAQTFTSWLVRDRGDGLRGSTPLGSAAEGAQRAVTHVRPIETVGPYTVVECRLETGRTHQIRIHLAEAGHRLCGEKLYTHALGQPAQPDASGAPRHVLHAAELRLVHPITGKPLRLRSPLPDDLRQWLLALRRAPGH